MYQIFYNYIGFEKKGRLNNLYGHGSGPVGFPCPGLLLTPQVAVEVVSVLVASCGFGQPGYCPCGPWQPGLSHVVVMPDYDYTSF